MRSRSSSILRPNTSSTGFMLPCAAPSCGSVRVEWPKQRPPRRTSSRWNAGWTASISNNTGCIVNYGERYRNGERISTGFVESTINQVVSKRMVKKQQMQWTPDSRCSGRPKERTSCSKSGPRCSTTAGKPPSAGGIQDSVPHRSRLRQHERRLDPRLFSALDMEIIYNYMGAPERGSAHVRPHYSTAVIPAKKISTPARNC